MDNFKMLNLQLFAGESAGGDGGAEGAATGGNATADAEQGLRDLGVPEDVLARRAKRKSARAGAAKVAPASDPEVTKEPTDEQDATAENNNPAEEKKTRMSWDEIKADPEYNKEIQSIVQARLRGAKASEEALSKLMPALEVLARKYGQDPSKIDYDALSKAIHDEDEYYEEKALEMGVSIQKAKEVDQHERQTAREQAEEARTLEQQKFDNHIKKLQDQGEAMKKIFPNFDLRTELQNPAFARMTSPNIGLSVEAAYYAVHHNEIQAAAMQATQRQTARKLSNSIQSGQRRPTENGTSAQAPSVTSFDYKRASKEERERHKAWVRAELAAGRKPRPGDYPG